MAKTTPKNRSKIVSKKKSRDGVTTRRRDGSFVRSQTTRYGGVTIVHQKYGLSDRSAPVKKAPAPVKKPSTASADARKAIDDIRKENVMIRKVMKENADVIKLARDKGQTNRVRLLEKAQDALGFALRHDKNIAKIREQRRIEMREARDWMQKAKNARD